MLDRLLFGFWSLFLSTRRIVQAAIILKPSTLLRFHAALVQRKYHRLYTPGNRTKPGPKGPSQELIRAIVELKQRNPRFGCPRIAQQMAYTFGIEIDKDAPLYVNLEFASHTRCKFRIRQPPMDLVVSSRNCLAKGMISWF